MWSTFMEVSCYLSCIDGHLDPSGVLNTFSVRSEAKFTRLFSRADGGRMQLKYHSKKSRFIWATISTDEKHVACEFIYKMFFVKEYCSTGCNDCWGIIFCLSEPDAQRFGFKGKVFFCLKHYEETKTNNVLLPLGFRQRQVLGQSCHLPAAFSHSVWSNLSCQNL